MTRGNDPIPIASTMIDVKVLPVINYSSTIAVLPRGRPKHRRMARPPFIAATRIMTRRRNWNDEAAIKAVTAVYRQGASKLEEKG